VAAFLLDPSADRFTSLVISGNTIKDLGATAIAEVLDKRGRDQLVSLDMRSNDIGPEGGEALFEALGRNDSLTALDLGVLGVHPQPCTLCVCERER